MQIILLLICRATILIIANDELIKEWSPVIAIVINSRLTGSWVVATTIRSEMCRLILGQFLLHLL